MADKKGVPSIINQEITKRNFLKGVLGAGGNTLLGTGLQALPTIIKSVSSSSPAIKATIPLLTEFFTIKGKIENLQSKIWGDIKFDKIENLQHPYDPDYDTQDRTEAERAIFYYNRMIQHKIDQSRHQKILNELETIIKLKKIDIEATLYLLPAEDEQIVLQYEEMLNELDTDSSDLSETLSTIKDLPKKSQNYIKKLMEYKNDQNTIRLIAEDNKVPFNYFSRFVSNELTGPITKESIKKAIDKQVSQRTPYYLESVERIKQLSTPAGLKEAIEKDLKFYKNTPEGGIKGWKNSTQHMTPQQADDWQREQIKKSTLKSLTNDKHINESNQNLKTRDWFESVNDMTWDYDYDTLPSNRQILGWDRSRRPSERKKLFNEIKEDLLSTAKTVGTDIAKDYVKEKFITKGGWKDQELKPGPWLKKLADYVKSLRTPKAPSGSTIESDKIRAEQAKEVKEVKQKVTPKRNLVQDLKGVGKVIKASPYVAATLTALTPTELDPEYTAELPLETSPRGYGVRKENRGRSSRDYYKTYNAQRLI